MEALFKRAVVGDALLEHLVNQGNINPAVIDWRNLVINKPPTALGQMKIAREIVAERLKQLGRDPALTLKYNSQTQHHRQNIATVLKTSFSADKAIQILQQGLKGRASKLYQHNINLVQKRQKQHHEKLAAMQLGHSGPLHAH